MPLKCLLFFCREMPTIVKLRSLQKSTVLYDKDDKRSDVEKRKRENKK